MTDTTYTERETANQARRRRKRERGHWYYAALFVQCPVCAQERGTFCVDRDGGKMEKVHHYVRYRKAREILRELYRANNQPRVIDPGYPVPGSPFAEGIKYENEEVKSA